METIEPVNLLWKNRHEISQPKKRRRLARFYKLFLRLILNVAGGGVYTLDAMQRSPWWDHLRPKYRQWSEEPLTETAVKEMQAAFQTSITLFHSIRENGVRDPLVMYWESGNRYMILGYRRLVICRVLGIDSVRVLTHPDYDTYARWRMSDGATSVGKLDNSAQRCPSGTSEA